MNSLLCKNYWIKSIIHPEIELSKISKEQESTMTYLQNKSFGGKKPSIQQELISPKYRKIKNLKYINTQYQVCLWKKSQIYKNLPLLHQRKKCGVSSSMKLLNLDKFQSLKLERWLISSMPMTNRTIQVVDSPYSDYLFIHIIIL